MSFTNTIAEWETFYLLTGTAAATLMGLLFVAVSIHVETFHQRTSNEMHLFAVLTFNCFFYVLLISIVFLIPHITGLGLGLPLLLFGLLAVVSTLIQQRRARKAHPGSGQAGFASRFNLPIVSLILLVLSSIGVLVGSSLGLYGYVAVIILLLMSASLNAWSLLVLSERESA